MLGLLTTYGPLIVKLGVYLINKFVSDPAERNKQIKLYLESIQLNINKAGEALELTNNVNDQINDLRRKP